MAKITITIEDDPNREGYVKVEAKPSFQEITKRMMSGDDPSTADLVATNTLLYIRNKSKSKLITPPSSIIKPN